MRRWKKKKYIFCQQRPFLKNIPWQKDYFFFLSGEQPALKKSSTHSYHKSRAQLDFWAIRISTQHLRGAQWTDHHSTVEVPGWRRTKRPSHIQISRCQTPKERQEIGFGFTPVFFIIISIIIFSYHQHSYYYFLVLSVSFLLFFFIHLYLR